MRIPLRRFGGDATTSYNWQNDVSNAASDWYLKTTRSTAEHPRCRRFVVRPVPRSEPPDGRAHSGHYLADGLDAEDTVSCSFSVAKYGAQTGVNQYNTNCGNGILLKNNQQIIDNPTDAYQPSDPAFEQQWVNTSSSVRPGQRRRRASVEHG